ncbi:MFS transporter [Oxalobacter vibrioformis]|uniref:MFS transporter n=1 Tax=Oxalobacter vibrioformis TaxID=933080 RepID=A0A9E9LZN5_9BURK|nr:MFS transporter [Oxalobacter vibrioformis]WAW10173.1 MFS transporter [Oxalobacter vibrioformis]
MTRSAYAEIPTDSRKTLFSMGSCYAMGTFNDNFFKQAALLLAATAGIGYVQGVATILFALPFVICSAWAGWLADRRPKNTLVILSKCVELGAMLLGVLALVYTSWFGMVLVIFLMGLQSTFFSPALNGAIPENFSAEEVPRVNALMKLATTVTILLGIALGGIFLDVPAIFPEKWIPEGDFGAGRVAVGVVGVLMAVAGILAAFGIRKSRPTAVSDEPFPLLGPADSVRHAVEYKREDPSLFLALAGEAFFYALSSFVLLCINNLGVRQLGLGVMATSMLAVSLSIGICIGAIVAGRHQATIWRRYLFPAGTGMVAGILFSSLVVFLPAYPFLLTGFLLVVYLLTGICAGMYLIPLVSTIQIRPADTEKGKVLGVSNFASFSGIILSGFFFALFDWVHELTGGAKPSTQLVWCGLAGLVFMFWAYRRLRVLFPFERYSPLGTFLRLVLALRYRITTTGLDTLDIRGPVLFLPNHPGLIDPFIVYSQLAGYSPRPLVDERQMAGLHGKMVARLLDAVLIPDMMKDGAKAVSETQRGIHVILDSLKAGDHVLMYPSGRVYHSSRENIGGNSGAWSLIQQAPDIQVVLVRTSGVWGSSFSYGATGKAPNFIRSLLQGILTVLGNVFLFAPRRRVHVDFIEAKGLAGVTDRRELNRYLEDFYNETERPAVQVPRWFWQGSKPVELPEYVVHKNVADTRDVNPDIRETVYRILRETAGLPENHPVYDSMSLSNDLGLDSLMLMEVSIGIEDAFQHSVPSLEMLNTVADCLLAASGQLGADELLPPAPDAWFLPPSAVPLELPTDLSCIVSAFFRQLKHNPKDPLLAERSGLKSRQQVFLGALIIAERFKALPGERLGIMVPSVPAAVVVWLAALLAGKTPVFFNWTVGEVNLKHCIDLTAVSHIVSVSPLMDRLERQGMPMESLSVEWVALDKMAASFSLVDKVRGVIKSRMMKDVRHFPVPQTAAVLFTSGSESFPKAVPLTHENLLTNAVDIIRVLNLASDDTVLAMLPPFHSFGLMVGLVIPMATGIKAVFHANPTEPALLNGLIRDFRVSLLAMPPTFMHALLEQAKDSDRLASVKYAFVGAEKCPEHVYQAFAEQCPSASLCEGYGITECAPAVSVNRPGDVHPGTIGPLLPSVTGVIVREDEGVIGGRAATGETGMLLVRGPSIFHGYIGDAPSPFVEFEGESWYRTGDLVSMDAAGRLTFQGRLKRFVKVGGEMISLPQIENVLLQAYGHHPDAPEEGVALAVEATREEEGTQIVLFTPLDLTLVEVNATLRSAGLSLLYAVKRIEKTDAIPLLGSGKTDYRALKARLSV